MELKLMDLLQYILLYLLEFLCWTATHIWFDMSFALLSVFYGHEMATPSPSLLFKNCNLMWHLKCLLWIHLYYGGICIILYTWGQM